MPAAWRSSASDFSLLPPVIVRCRPAVKHSTVTIHFIFQWSCCLLLFLSFFSPPCLAHFYLPFFFFLFKRIFYFIVVRPDRAGWGQSGAAGDSDVRSVPSALLALSLQLDLSCQFKDFALIMSKSRSRRWWVTFLITTVKAVICCQELFLKHSCDSKSRQAVSSSLSSPRVDWDATVMTATWGGCIQGNCELSNWREVQIPQLCS